MKTCDQVKDDLARVVDGTAPTELYEHIADCDACRDLRHEAAAVVTKIRDASCDFKPQSDLELRLLAPLDARSVRKPRRPSRRQVVVVAVTATVALAAGLALVVRSRGPKTDSRTAVSSWKGEIEAVVRASKDPTGGLVQCDAAANCVGLDTGAAVTAGLLLRTDDRTRVRLRMSDGTRLVLDRGTELSFGTGRSADLRKGALVADVVHLDSQDNARFSVPGGGIDVLGTKFAVVAGDGRSRVQVTRGVVRLRNGRGSEEVHAGEEGRVGSEAIAVVPTVALGDSVAWAEQGLDSGTEVSARGLGELRAKKPGESNERDRAVSLTSHNVKVRIVDGFARTEIDEVFSNDAPDELEGIYRFPLPPGAEVERLALEVNGKLEEGAFVEKGRAAAIWRGVIQHATPQAKAPVDDIVWVPGPWRDPALLEWKRGGRFELRIFPIPAKGSRRIVLAYTEHVPVVGGLRRYVYPLPVDPKAAPVGQFKVDAQVLGHDLRGGVQARGYDMSRSTEGGAERLAFERSAFVPAGDLTLDYGLADPTAQVSAYSYAVTNEVKPYVALALRPTLPRVREVEHRDHVIVLDRSRSMVGERFGRARALALGLVRELDGHDRVKALVCDTTCDGTEWLDAGPGATATLERLFAAVVPDGATDLAAIAREARKAAGAREAGRRLAITYLGDGAASAGPIKAAHLSLEVRRALSGLPVTLTAVAVGADADVPLLAAFARGGGGAVVPYVPGQPTSVAALGVLGAVYGVALRDPVLTLPAGLSEVAPSTLDTMLAGGETLVVARAEGSTVEGDAVLRGTVGGEAFEQRYPLRIVAGEGNGFVPRLFGSLRIGELERAGGTKEAIVELSKRFALASRYTSLLVLESEAMFQAFGLDRTRSLPQWTGETAATATTSRDPSQEPLDSLAKEADGLALGALDMRSAPASGAGAPAQSPPMQRRPTVSRDEFDGPSMGRPGRRWIAMRRIWVRTGAVSTDVSAWHTSHVARIAEAEAAFAKTPDRRAATQSLLALYAQHGLLDKAQTLAEQWASRDPLDPDALVARADLAARSGDRTEALRRLGSVVDVRPETASVQTRLSELYERLGDPVRACAHRVAQAELSPDDAVALSKAVRCSREGGATELAMRLLADASAAIRTAAERVLGAPVLA
ncbi:MAG: VIT domain-containing protein, partial [Myxococcales bacterium]